MLENEISIPNLKNIQNISCLTSTWASNSLKGHPLVCNLGLQFFKGTYLATVLQSWFIGVRFFKAEICPGSHSLRGYQWSLKDSGVRVGGRIARGMFLAFFWQVTKAAMREVTHMVPGRGGWTMLEHDPLPRRAKSVPVRSKPWFAGFNVFERCHASRAYCLKLLACAFVLDNTVAENKLPAEQCNGVQSWPSI